MDTIGPASFDGSVGGDGADGQYGERDDGVGHHQHQQALEEASVAHDEPCKGGGEPWVITLGVSPTQATQARAVLWSASRLGLDLVVAL